MGEVGALVQWLNLPGWKIGDHGLEPHSGLQVSKKQKFLQYCGEPPWPGGSVFDLRPPGLEF